jgi:hypothetical protein
MFQSVISYQLSVTLSIYYLALIYDKLLIINYYYTYRFSDNYANKGMSKGCPYKPFQRATLVVAL